MATETEGEGAVGEGQHQGQRPLFLACVQPVAIRRPSFWVIYIFCICVAFVSVENAGVNMDLMYCLYVRVISSLVWPNVVLVSARRTLRRVLAL